MQEARATFSEKSDEYARQRPQYPPSLFEWLAAQCTRREVAWDCATGNGQAALGLAPLFTVVHATDASAAQIAHAVPASNVAYSVQPAEATTLPGHGIDLVTVAQALHWFDHPRFWAEVQRVGREGSLFAAWGYDWPYVSPEVDRDLIRPFRAIIQPFWASNNRILWNGYRDEDLDFPFTRLNPPPFEITVRWTLSQLLAYMRTWSAYKRSESDPGATAEMAGLMARISTGMGGSPVTVRMPLHTLVGRIV